MANIYDMADTWNDGATTFTAIKMNVTDTASAAASSLMDLQVGGVSKFSAGKDGNISVIGAGSAGAAIIKMADRGDVITAYGTAFGNQPLRVNMPAGLALLNDTSALYFGAASDLALHRDAANTLALRNGVNAQTFNIYNTYTDASNYERAHFVWGGDTFYFGTSSAGTGSARPMFVQAGGTLNLGGQNVSTLQLLQRSMVHTPTEVTGSLSDTAFSIAQTWNTTGAPTAIKLNVTNAASGAASKLMDLQVGGTSKLTVTKDAAVYVPLNGYFGDDTGSRVRLSVSSTPYVTVGGSGSGFFGWADNNIQVPDILLVRDAAGTLAQRNGTNAQAFRLYNTYTDASNYERGLIGWVSNTFRIGSESAGTGATRAMHFYAGGVRVAVVDSSFFQIDKDFYCVANQYSGSYFTQFTEMTAPSAPSANNVRIYAEDDGAGKTRLMALFATGAAQQIAIEP